MGVLLLILDFDSPEDYKTHHETFTTAWHNTWREWGGSGDDRGPLGSKPAFRTASIRTWTKFRRLHEAFSTPGWKAWPASQNPWSIAHYSQRTDKTTTVVTFNPPENVPNHHPIPDWAGMVSGWDPSRREPRIWFSDPVTKPPTGEVALWSTARRGIQPYEEFVSVWDRRHSTGDGQSESVPQTGAAIASDVTGQGQMSTPAVYSPHYRTPTSWTPSLSDVAPPLAPGFETALLVQYYPDVGPSSGLSPELESASQGESGQSASAAFTLDGMGNDDELGPTLTKMMQDFELPEE